jgi:hypothetical protein
MLLLLPQSCMHAVAGCLSANILLLHVVLLLTQLAAAAELAAAD